MGRTRVRRDDVSCLHTERVQLLRSQA